MAPLFYNSNTRRFFMVVSKKNTEAIQASERQSIGAENV